MKKGYSLLFSISAAIGQFSSKWPGSSSCTVKSKLHIASASAKCMNAGAFQLLDSF